MMIEKSGTIRLKDIHIPQGGTPEQQELAQGMVRVNHLYRSALKVAVTQLEILDEEFASLYDHSPIHHIEYRIKTVDSIVEKLKRRGFEVTIDNIYAHIQDVAGVRVICNYLDDICYLRSLLARNENFRIIREVNYIKEPKESGYRSLHLICDVPIVISEGTLHLPVEIQLRTIAMDMWASLEHELRYKSQRDFSPSDAARLRLCSDAISEIDREMQDIYQGRGPGRRSRRWHRHPRQRHRHGGRGQVHGHRPRERKRAGAHRGPHAGKEPHHESHHGRCRAKGGRDRVLAAGDGYRRSASAGGRGTGAGNLCAVNNKM